MILHTPPTLNIIKLSLTTTIIIARICKAILAVDIANSCFGIGKILLVFNLNHDHDAGNFKGTSDYQLLSRPLG